uniref:asparagine synthase (glutamine-hydrolyzing) n=1 Tax=viral metagenome TaxID=1070528 RepID=A0A6C0CM62_9ZZZZ
MCGIWATLFENGGLKKSELIYYNKFRELKPRGPETTKYETIYDDDGSPVEIMLGFHRLAIMGPDHAGDQPFKITTSVEVEGKVKTRTITTVCNGEIYNFQKLIKKHSLPVHSHTDCEVIPYLYEKLGMKKMCRALDGVFAILVLDKIEGQPVKVIAARDPFGVRPLFYGFDSDKHTFTFSSEIKGMTGICSKIIPFPPGKYYVQSKNKFYDYCPDLKEFEPMSGDVAPAREEVLATIREKFTKAVHKRIHADRPLGCLLSGGLDSSIVAAIAAKYLQDHEQPPLKTFSIGLKGGTDEIWAKKVAEHIGSDHTCVTITTKDALNAIRKTIEVTETYDITTIRASTWQYLLGKYITENTDIKVVLNGDGSDEVMQGYKYFHNQPSSEDGFKEAVRLVGDIYLFDVLRVDRAISGNGLEARVPFLDKDFVKYFLSLPVEMQSPSDSIEKHLFRSAFDETELLPKDVLWRSKEAFSDGCSSQENSWHTLIQKHVKKKKVEKPAKCTHLYNRLVPQTREALYFRQIFGEIFGEEYNEVLPYYWLPRWCGDIQDPSARVLDVYSSS